MEKFEQNGETIGVIQKGGRWHVVRLSSRGTEFIMVGSYVHCCQMIETLYHSLQKGGRK